MRRFASVSPEKSGIGYIAQLPRMCKIHQESKWINTRYPPLLRC
jgi:hypothetical protein